MNIALLITALVIFAIILPLISKKTGFKFPLSLLIFFAIITSYLLLTQPGSSLTEEFKIAYLTHKLYAAIALMITIYLATLSLIQYRADKKSQSNSKTG
jgi:hypothetical protein